MSKPERIETIDQMHKRFLIEALRRSKGNRKETAEMLGISERTVYHKMNKFDIPMRKKTP